LNLNKLDKEIEALEKELFTKDGDMVDTIDEASKGLESPEATPEEGSMPEPEVTPEPESQTTRKRTSYKAVASELQEELDQFKLRYNKLRASRDSKLYELRTKSTALVEENLSLKQNIAMLTDKIGELSNSTDNLENIFSPEEVDALGEDAVNSFTKVTRTAVDSAVKPLKEELDRLKAERLAEEQRQLKYQQRRNQSQFEEKLEGLVPDYDSIDKDPAFEKYIMGYDEISGAKRFDLFKNAQASNDVYRVAKFFNEFKDLSKPPVSKLESEITPTGSQQAVIQTQTKPDTVKESEWAKFNRDVAKGRYKHKQKLKDELDDFYDKAIMEGRMIFGA
jgi:hypothetical protein